MPLPYNRNLIPSAKELRKNATRQENHLWYDYLRSYPVRFQRQKSIAGFIVDFYCYSAKLIIELDGAQHFSAEGLQYDEERTKVLEEYELRVLRFSNSDVDNNFKWVCQVIDATVKESLKKPPSERDRDAIS